MLADAALAAGAEDRFGRREDRSESLPDLEQSSQDLEKSSHDLDEAAAVLTVFRNVRSCFAVVIERSFHDLFRVAAAPFYAREDLWESKA